MNPQQPYDQYNTGYTPTTSYNAGNNTNLSNIPKKYFVIGGVLLVSLIALLSWLGMGKSGYLELAAPATTLNNQNVEVTILENGSEKKLSLKAGETKKIRLGSGQVQVNGSVGEIKSIDIVQINGRQTTRLQTPTGQQQYAIQQASDVSDCPLQVDTMFYSYNCNGDGGIVRHAPGPFGNSVNTRLFDGQIFTMLEPYKKGLLGMQQSDTATLVYIDLVANTIQPIRLPAEPAGKLANTQGLQIVTTKESNKAQFMLSFAYDKMYLFKDLGDQQPAQVTYGEGITPDNKYRIRSTSFSGDTLVIYSGAHSEPLDGTADNAEQNTDNEGTAKDPESLNLTSYLFEYDLSGKLTRTLTMPEGSKPDRVQKLTGNYYIAESTSAFNFLYLEGNTFRVIYNLQEVGSWLTLNNKAYVQAGGVAYEFVAKDSGMFGLHSVFSSSKLAISELFLGTTGLLLTGTPAGDTTSATNLYSLSKDAPAQPVGSDQQPNSKVQGEPGYQGFDELIEVGISSEQVDNLKLALGRYITTAKQSVRTVSVDSVNTDYSQTSSLSVANFTVGLDDKFYSARMDYSGRQVIRLTLNELSGDKKQIFDSGPVGQ